MYGSLVFISSPSLRRVAEFDYHQAGRIEWVLTFKSHFFFPSPSERSKICQSAQGRVVLSLTWLLWPLAGMEVFLYRG